MAVETDPRHDGTQDSGGGPFESLSRWLFVWFILPVVALYPILYLRADEDERLHTARLTAFDTVPGLSATSWLPAVGYGGCFLVLVYLVSALAVVVNPFGSAMVYTGVVVASVLVGVAATFLLKSVGLERSLAKRLASVVPVAFLFGTVVAGRASTVYPQVAGQPSATLVPPLAVLVGALAGNGYLVKSLDREQKLTGPHEGEQYLQSDQDAGTGVDDGTGRDLVAEFGKNTWAAPDDLGKRCEVLRTRRMSTYRDVERRLLVDEARRRDEVPEPQFRREKSRHRTDYENRESVAPEGFTSKRYTFFVPDSKRVRTCRNCSGRGEVDCATCETAGEVTCGRCGGHGRDDCGTCRGDGEVSVSERCPVCGGSGEQCTSCGGSGTVRETERCSGCGGSGEETCSNCAGSGEVTCDRCHGSGDHECEDCEGTGNRVRFEYVRRQYTAEENVAHRLNSIPESVVSDAEGSLERRETDEDPDEDGCYRYQEEVREIPVLAATYRYRGDAWELFEVESDVEALEYPRDFRKQLRIVQACALLIMPTMVLLMFL